MMDLNTGVGGWGWGPGGGGDLLLMHGAGCCSTSVPLTGSSYSCRFQFWNGGREELGLIATGVFFG